MQGRHDTTSHQSGLHSAHAHSAPGRITDRAEPTDDRTVTAPKSVDCVANTRNTEALVGRIRQRIGQEAYERYLGRGAGLELTDQGLEITLPNRFAADLINNRFGNDIRRAAQEASGAEIPVNLRVAPAPSRPSPSRTSPSSPGHPAPGTADAPVRNGAEPSAPLRPTAPARRPSRARAESDTRTIESFIVGRANRLAFEATRRVAEDEDTGGSCPLFLYGPCGVGKSHLLHAAARRFRERFPAAKVRVVSAETFTNEYIGAIRTGKIEAFHRAHRKTDLLCIDDVHFLSKKSGTQNELLHTFDALDVRGSRVILASDCHPRQIKAFNAALVSRFVSGSMARIDAPDEDTRARLISAFARRSGLAIDPAAVDALAAGAEGGTPGEPASVRDLLGLVNRAKAYLSINTTLRTQRVTAAVADAVMRADDPDSDDDVPGRPVPIDRIIRSVCETVAVTPADLAGKGRSKPVVLARALVTLLARKLTRRSYPEIAEAIGRPTHSTVIGAYKRITAQIEKGETVDAGLHCDGMPIGLLADRLERELRVR